MDNAHFLPIVPRIILNVFPDENMSQFFNNILRNYNTFPYEFKYSLLNFRVPWKQKKFYPLLVCGLLVHIS